MNLLHLKNRLLAVVATVGAMSLSGHVQAANFSYHVDLNVAALLAAPTTGPYSLDFQLNGDGLPAAATNTVTLSNFMFTLGSASGAATTFGNASGNLGAGVVLTLNAANTFNEFYQGFSTTTADIQFDVSSTQNGSGITPDTFLVSILDNSLGQITTNAPDTASLVTESINGTVTLANVHSYQSTSPAGVIANVVPEPSSWAVMTLSCVALAGVILRRRSRHA